jgi:SAM-dependent methyltransferase
MLAAEFPQARNFLEIGCGTGFVLEAIHRELPRLEISGSELFSDGLVFAKRRVQNATFYQLDARQLPFSEEFDVVGAFDVLEHIPDDELALAQARAAVKQGGGIVVTVPQHRWLWSSLDASSHHQRRYSKSELFGKLRRAGFEPVRSTSFVATLLPIMFLSRISQPKSPAEVDLEGELRVGTLANRILSSIMKFEEVTIKRGFPWQFGGSLLVAARTT